MRITKRGARGSDVRALQLRLNVRLHPSPRLALDGDFGPATEAAVVRFQGQIGLAVDGVVGLQTWAALQRPDPSVAPPLIDKFIRELGTVEHFVVHLKGKEAKHAKTSDVMADLAEFFQTQEKSRYLIVTGDRATVIDFRHFFAAASESYGATRSKKMGLGSSSSQGKTELLGVLNEIDQCSNELVELKMNSCFSREDLGSNRLGGRFGEIVKIKESEASRSPLHELLRDYLNSLKPLPARQVSKAKSPGGWDTIVEVVSALGQGVYDALVPSAY